MSFGLKEPRMVADARAQSKARPLIIEILILLAVFIVAQIAVAIIGVLFAMPMGIFIGLSSGMSGDGSPEDIMAATMALATSSPMLILSLFATVGIIAITIVYCRFIEKRRVSTMGLGRKHAVREWLLGGAIGVALFSLAVAICVATGTLTFEGSPAGIAWGFILLFFLGFMVQGASEEILCRGYFMISLARKQSLVIAIVLSSLVFSLAHLANPSFSINAMINIFLVGCVFGVYAIKRGSLWGACAMHSLWNFVQGNIFGISVSGNPPMDTVFSFVPTTGGTLLNGGGFGLEGGLAVTIVLVLALAGALFLKQKETTSTWAPPTVQEQ
jgi:membrane protease YdiL (CAAX protease family)